MHKSWGVSRKNSLKQNLHERAKEENNWSFGMMLRGRVLILKSTVVMLAIKWDLLPKSVFQKLCFLRKKICLIACMFSWALLQKQPQL